MIPYEPPTPRRREKGGNQLAVHADAPQDEQDRVKAAAAEIFAANVAVMQSGGRPLGRKKRDPFHKKPRK